MIDKVVAALSVENMVTVLF